MFIKRHRKKSISCVVRVWLKKWVLESKLDKEEVMKKECPGRKKKGKCCRFWCYQRTLRVVSQGSKPRGGGLTDLLSYDEFWNYGHGSGWLRSSAGDQQREGSWESDKSAYEKGCLLGAGSVEGWGRHHQGLPQLSIKSLCSKHLLLTIIVAFQTNQRIFTACQLFSQHFTKHCEETLACKNV